MWIVQSQTVGNPTATTGNTTITDTSIKIETQHIGTHRKAQCQIQTINIISTPTKIVPVLSITPVPVRHQNTITNAQRIKQKESIKQITHIVYQKQSVLSQSQYSPILVTSIISSTLV